MMVSVPVLEGDITFGRSLCNLVDYVDGISAKTE